MVSTSSKMKRKGFHLGVDAYLRKPVDRTELIRELRSLAGQPPLLQVLIIDDEERDRYLLKQRLSRAAAPDRRGSGGRRAFAPLANTSRTSYSWILAWPA